MRFEHKSLIEVMLTGSFYLSAAMSFVLKGRLLDCGSIGISNWTAVFVK